MDTDPEYKAVDFWLSLIRRTQEYFDLGPDQWKYPINLDVSKEDEYERWISRCSQHSEKIDAIIRERLSVGAPTQEDQEFLYLVSARYAAVGALLMNFVYKSEHGWRAVAQPHSFDEDKVFESLLLDWWHQVGKDCVFERLWSGTMSNDFTK